VTFILYSIAVVKLLCIIKEDIIEQRLFTYNIAIYEDKTIYSKLFNLVYLFKTIHSYLLKTIQSYYYIDYPSTQSYLPINRT